MGAGISGEGEVKTFANIFGLAAICNAVMGLHPACRNSYDTIGTISGVLIGLSFTEGNADAILSALRAAERG